MTVFPLPPDMQIRNRGRGFSYKGLPNNFGSLTPTSDAGSDASWELFWELMEVSGQSWHLVSAAICDAPGDHLTVCESLS